MSVRNRQGNKPVGGDKNGGTGGRLEKAHVDNVEESNTNASSKEDENLIQNWSLTFTEYMQDAAPRKDQLVDKRGGRVGNDTHNDEDEDEDFIPSDDNRGEGLSDDSKATGQANTDDAVAENGFSETDRDELGVQPIKPVHIHVETGGLESANNDASEVGTDKLLTETAETETKAERGSNRNKKGGKYSREDVEWYNEDLQEQINLKHERINATHGTLFSKQRVLPSIGNNSNNGVRLASVSQTADTRDDIKRREVGNIGFTDANAGLAEKPVVNGEIVGKVQPIYMRFPGQRQGQMVYAEMNQQSGRVRIVSRDKEKEMLSRLSWLLLDGGTAALRSTFDSVHPALSLREHLNQPHVRAVLQKLLAQDVLSDKHWKLLYPSKKKHCSSHKFDSRLLVVLLQTICHLCPPYPSGWTTDPMPTDGSLSADIVRLQLLFQEMAKHEAITGDVYGLFFGQIRDVIVRLGGPPIRVKIARIESELINLDMQQHYIKTLRETWHPDIIQRLERLQESRTKTSRGRKKNSDNKGGEEGLSPEDRVVLKKTHKLLVDTLQAEDVIDRLQQSQILKHSDRQEILAVSKKAERMNMLLDKIGESKLPYALKSLLDAMKFKYKKLHEHVSAVRKQTYKEGVVFTVDVSGICHDALVASYKSTFSRVYPFPWSDAIHCSVRDMYTPLDVIDQDGNKLHSSELLPPPGPYGRGQRILLEGGSGSGKSVLCAWLAYTWATQPKYFKNPYKLVLYLDCYNLSGDFREAAYKELFPDNFRISFNEFWNMVERKGSDVLFVIDGLDQTDSVEISNILTGTYLKECTVLVTANPDNLGTKGLPVDSRWYNIGFSEANIKRCFRTCALLSDREHEQFEKLYHLAGRESWQLRPFLTKPMLAIKAFATYDILRKSTILKEMKTVCDLLEKYGAAMATAYCRKQKIDIIGFEFPDEVLQAAEGLDRFAFTCILNDTMQFTEAEVQEEAGSQVALRFGAFNKFSCKTKLKFASGISRDFLAARHIADMVYEDMEATILRNKMVKFPKYRQLMSFLYGQYRRDADTPVLETLFDQLAARNEYCFRGTRLPDPAPNPGSTPGAGSPVAGAIEGGGRGAKVPRGVLQDFQTSLQCLAECPERSEVIGMIASSLPQRLIIKSESMLPLGSVRGLCAVLMDAACTVTEMELELHQYHHSQLPAFLKLANATSRCRHMRSIKVTWSSVDIMAKFLAGVMENGSGVETVSLIEDVTKKAIKSVSAATWAALQAACNNMVSVQRLSFLGSRVTPILYHVLQHVPNTIASIDLTGCALNLMCAGEISRHLDGNTAIRSLNLSNVRMRSTEFVAIFQGMQMCLGIREVILRGAHLDRPCVVALSEYIKLTHSLEVLDLSNCELSTDMCVRLVSSIRHNRTLNKLIFNDTKVTSEGRKVISKTKTKVQPVRVEGLVGIYA